VGNSEMVDVYCHLAMSDMEDAVRKLNKLPLKEKTEDDKPNCPRCGGLRDIGSLECRNCGEKFSTRSACELEHHEQNLIHLAKALLKRAEENPEIVEMLLKERKG
jgi:tRNA(Ile2) C34 agmatinyltransferase TiaS